MELEVVVLVVEVVGWGSKTLGVVVVQWGEVVVKGLPLWLPRELQSYWNPIFWLCVAVVLLAGVEEVVVARAAGHSEHLWWLQHVCLPLVEPGPCLAYCQEEVPVQL